MLNRSICLILGYFVGAIIQTGFWIGKFNHIDIRDYGSGNAGTTNTMRTLGKKALLLLSYISYMAITAAFQKCYLFFMVVSELCLDIISHSILVLRVERV